MVFDSGEGMASTRECVTDLMLGAELDAPCPEALRIR